MAEYQAFAVYSGKREIVYAGGKRPRARLSVRWWKVAQELPDPALGTGMNSKKPAESQVGSPFVHPRSATLAFHLQLFLQHMLHLRRLQH